MLVPLEGSSQAGVTELASAKLQGVRRVFAGACPEGRVAEWSRQAGVATAWSLLMRMQSARFLIDVRGSEK